MNKKEVVLSFRTSSERKRKLMVYLAQRGQTLKAFLETCIDQKIERVKNDKQK